MTIWNISAIRERESAARSFGTHWLPRAMMACLGQPASQVNAFLTKSDFLIALHTKIGWYNGTLTLNYYWNEVSVVSWGQFMTPDRALSSAFGLRSPDYGRLAGCHPLLVRFPSDRYRKFSDVLNIRIRCHKITAMTLHRIRCHIWHVQNYNDIEWHWLHAASPWLCSSWERL